MAATKDRAVCLRTWDWSETSQTAALFSREHGLVRVVAKGSRRERSPFSGGLEPLTRGEMVVILKSTGALSTLTEWDVQEFFPEVRRSLPAFYAGMYAADLVLHSVTDADPHPALYDALVTGLRGLGGPLAEMLATLQWAVLRETGHGPEVDADVATGEELAPAETYGFSAERGGLVRDEGGAGPRLWRVRAGTVDVLRGLAAGGGCMGADAGSVARAARLLAAYCRDLLGQELPTLGPVLNTVIADEPVK